MSDFHITFPCGFSIGAPTQKGLESLIASLPDYIGAVQACAPELPLFKSPQVQGGRGASSAMADPTADLPNVKRWQELNASKRFRLTNEEGNTYGKGSAPDNIVREAAAKARLIAMGETPIQSGALMKEAASAQGYVFASDDETFADDALEDGVDDD